MSCSTCGVDFNRVGSLSSIGLGGAPVSNTEGVELQGLHDYNEL